MEEKILESISVAMAFFDVLTKLVSDCFGYSFQNPSHYMVANGYVN